MKYKFISLFVSVVLAAPALAGGPAPHWDYDGEAGPSKWAGIDSAFKTCGIGKRQSPINIETRDAEKGGLKPIAFTYLPGPAEVVNNGADSGRAGLIVNSSRAILYADPDNHVGGAARVARDTRDALNAAR